MTVPKEFILLAMVAFVIGCALLYVGFAVIENKWLQLPMIIIGALGVSPLPAFGWAEILSWFMEKNREPY